jgi:hypothetical protein
VSPSEFVSPKYLEFTVSIESRAEVTEDFSGRGSSA